jgi:hypothetical protein
VGSGDDGETGSRGAGTWKARSEGVREWRKGRNRSSVATIPKKEIGASAWKKARKKCQRKRGKQGRRKTGERNEAKREEEERKGTYLRLRGEHHWRVKDARGPRLCGSHCGRYSGRGRKCVRSKRPHLLHNYESISKRTRKRNRGILTTFSDYSSATYSFVSVVQQLKTVCARDH